MVAKLKVPPNSKEAERGVLGSILLDPETVLEKCIEAGLDDGCFYDRRNQKLYSAIIDMHSKADARDALIIAENLKRDNLLDQIGGFDHLLELQDSIGVTAHVEHYVGILIDKRRKRLVIKISNDAIKAAYRDDNSQDIINGLSAGMEVVDGLITDPTRTTHELIADALELDTKVVNGEKLGLPFPWHDFQRRTFGIPSKAVTPMGGRDGKGKSRLMTFLATHWVSIGIPILYFPFEDGGERFISNMSASFGEYDMFTARRDFVPDTWLPHHKASMERVSHFPIYVEDEACSAEKMAGIIARYKRKYGICGVVVDGLKDIIPTKGDGEVAQENHTNAVLIRAARKHDVALITVSHLRDVVDDTWLSKQSIRGSKRQSQSGRMVLMYQDSGIPEPVRCQYNLFGDEIVLDAQKTSYGSPGIVVLRPELEKGRFVLVEKVNAE